MRVLVIDDAVRMARSVKKGLTEVGYEVDIAGNGSDGLQLARTGDYDLVLLDVNLPGIDGFAFLRQLRANRSDVPVIFVTARDSVADRVEGLNVGGDDYLVKPFAFEELLARMRALLRRPGARAKPILSFEDIELDPAKGQAFRNGRLLPLSSREFALLHVFMSNVNQVMSRARLFEAVWNATYEGQSNVLEVYVNYVRNKLEDQGSRVIFTVRGQGYLFGNAIK
jgi:DNA-binding response OmpR family regulator